jgi:hypothetical protein
MAKMKCKCDKIIRDDDSNDSLFLLTREQFDVDLDSVMLFGKAVLALKCNRCGRLWVYWGNGNVADEYVHVVEPGLDSEAPAPGV